MTAARYGEQSFWNDRYACAEDEGFDCKSRGQSAAQQPGLSARARALS